MMLIIPKAIACFSNPREGEGMCLRPHMSVCSFYRVSFFFFALSMSIQTEFQCIYS